MTRKWLLLFSFFVSPLLSATNYSTRQLQILESLYEKNKNPGTHLIQQAILEMQKGYVNGEEIILNKEDIEKGLLICKYSASEGKEQCKNETICSTTKHILKQLYTRNKYPSDTDIFNAIGEMLERLDECEWVPSHTQIKNWFQNTRILKKETRPKSHPSAAVKVLNHWLLSHTEHPYPKPEEKEDLVRQSGLTLKQVNNWFSNIRQRKLKKVGKKACFERKRKSNTQTPSSRPCKKVRHHQADANTQYHHDSLDQFDPFFPPLSGNNSQTSAANNSIDPNKDQIQNEYPLPMENQPSPWVCCVREKQTNLQNDPEGNNASYEILWDAPWDWDDFQGTIPLPENFKIEQQFDIKNNTGSCFDIEIYDEKKGEWIKEQVFFDIKNEEEKHCNNNNHNESFDF